MNDSAIPNATPLSRLLRTAVLAGVESTVRLHIDRGDDLNARDDKGQTPLMLSAARNKAVICKLLINAGADPSLLDPSGRTALSIAQAAQAAEAALVLESAYVLCPVQRDPLSDPVPPPPDSPPAKAVISLQSHQAKVIATKQPTALEKDSAALPVIDQSQDGDDSEFDLTGWVAEQEPPPPMGDPALAVTALELQSAIALHAPIDTSADWSSLEVLLPERATPLPHADDAETRERLRLILLRAIREGSVPFALIDATSLVDDSKSSYEAVALLSMIINDLGAEIDDRFEYCSPHESFEVFVDPEEKPDEEESLDDALAFFDELKGRQNEPLRIHQREFQGEALLTTEAVVTLGQAMEHSIEKALDELCNWPRGLRAVMRAAKDVTTGAKRLREISSGPRAEVSEIETSSTEPNPQGEGDAEVDLDGNGSSNELEEFRINAELLAGILGDPNQEDVRRSTIASLGLSRNFLIELAEMGSSNESAQEIAFSLAMTTYRQARDKMVVANLKLVFSIAKKYLYSGEPLDDLLQEGTIGLMIAIDRWNWRLGYKFSTYATWWIRQRVTRYIADKGKTIRLPVHVFETTQRIDKETRSFELQHGNTPTEKDIAELLELPIKKIIALNQSVMEPLPLHEVTELDNLIALDAKDQYSTDDPLDIVEKRHLVEVIDRILGAITPKKNAQIMRMRFGIGIGESMTLDEIGARIGKTRERVRQIEKAALRDLKNQAQRELNDSPPVSSENNQRPTEADDEGDEPTTQVAADIPLQKLLSYARALGIKVEDYPVGPDRRIWVYLEETHDKYSREVGLKLLEFGFSFSANKGYWR